MPDVVAAALVNEFTEHDVTAQDGSESDRDVVFEDVEILVEEKAVGVCHRDVAEQYAPSYVELDRDDDTVLAINVAQIMETYIP